MYVDVAHGGHCSNSATTTCSTTPFTFQQIVDSVVAGMFTTMVSNDARPTYVHQTNIMGAAPATIPATPPNTSTAVGDGLLYSALNPLFAKYHTYFNATAPYQQPTMGAIANHPCRPEHVGGQPGARHGEYCKHDRRVADGREHRDYQQGCHLRRRSDHVAARILAQQRAVRVPVRRSRSAWETLAPGASITISAAPPAVTSSATATAQVGSAFTFAVTTSGTAVGHAGSRRRNAPGRPDIHAGHGCRHGHDHRHSGGGNRRHLPDHLHGARTWSGLPVPPRRSRCSSPIRRSRWRRRPTRRPSRPRARPSRRATS